VCGGKGAQEVVSNPFGVLEIYEGFISLHGCARQYFLEQRSIEIIVESS
jgi:hypothetical protein